MRPDRPGFGEEWNEGEATQARQAASLILLRDSPDGPEVLLVERNPEQRFMGGAWVFPGGAVHAEDEDHAGTALRELEEEAGVGVGDVSALVPFSRWITPAEAKIRFDTHFFVAHAPAHTEAHPDGSECVAARWLRPRDALAANERGELQLVFPTIKHLEQLCGFDSVEATLEAARRREITPVQPKVTVDEGSPRIVLPGEPGY
ncbi:MAG: NUDIX domain-containing protein [Thermoleophilaceae bacterium]